MRKIMTNTTAPVKKPLPVESKTVTYITYDDGSVKESVRMTKNGFSTIEEAFKKTIEDLKEGETLTFINIFKGYGEAEGFNVDADISRTA